jgi:hypothetical protein
MDASYSFFRLELDFAITNDSQIALAVSVLTPEYMQQCYYTSACIEILEHFSHPIRAIIIVLKKP